MGRVPPAAAAAAAAAPPPPANGLIEHLSSDTILMQNDIQIYIGFDIAPTLKNGNLTKRYYVPISLATVVLTVAYIQ